MSTRVNRRGARSALRRLRCLRFALLVVRVALVSDAPGAVAPLVGCACVAVVALRQGVDHCPKRVPLPRHLGELGADDSELLLPLWRGLFAWLLVVEQGAQVVADGQAVHATAVLLELV